MPTLLDALNSGTTISPLGAQPGMGSTSQVAQLLQAKTGRAVDDSLGGGMGGTPRMSTLGEAGAVAQTGAQLGQVHQQAAAQQQDLGAKSDAQAGQADFEREKVESQRLDTISQHATRTAQLIQDYKQSMGKLGGQEQQALADQIGQSARLSTDQYVSALENAGEEQRLSDSTSFREATAKAVFQDEKQLFSDQFKADEMLNMHQNQWKEWLGNIDLNTALGIAAQQATTANNQAMWTGVGNATSAGVDMYSNTNKQQPKAPQ